MSNGRGFNTRAVHSGELKIREFGNVVTPIFQTATFDHPNRSDSPYIDNTRGVPFLYSRLGNPTIQALEEKYASLDNAAYALAFSSGMAAITSTVLSMAAKGKDILSTSELYGQTHHFFTSNLGHYGHAVKFVSTEDLNNLEFNPEGFSFVYTESIINPTQKVTDLKEVARLCNEKGVPMIVDATFASPFNQNPLDLGCSIVVHSGTKYISGHSDVTLGLAGISSGEYYGKISETRKTLGPSADPLQAYLAMRGLKTLGLRVQKQNLVALEIAKFLEQHKKVKQVMYPGLQSSPYHEIAERNLRGYGGMLSFELEEGYEGAKKFLSGLTIPSAAASLGGIESLVTLPVETSHADVPKEARHAMGIPDGLIRFSCGIEDHEDIIQDIDTALGKV